MSPKSDSWTGRTGFILATIGSAVGIGSIWKFPYEVGANGGGAFVLFYLLGLILVVVPLMLAEFAVGRHGRADAIHSIGVAAITSKASPRWAAIGLLGAVTAFLILSFYSVIGGWAIAYALETIYLGLPVPDASATRARFDTLLASPWQMSIFHALFMTATATIVARGIAHGIEAACKVMTPALVILIVALAVYSIVEGDVATTLRFLFAPDLGKFTARAALEAIGLGFFSIGVGFALMITYAAYADRSINLSEVAVIAVVGDTVISLLSGFAVFPLVFANSLDPSSGPGLIFVTLPLAFARMPGGSAAAVAFYALLVTAALASAISMLELGVASLVRRGWTRIHASALLASTAWTLGIATVLSFNIWATWFPLSLVRGLEKATWFEALDHVTSNVLLPIGGLALAVFAGWILPDRLLREELNIGDLRHRLLRTLLRWVAPAVIAAVTLVPYFG